MRHVRSFLVWANSDHWTAMSPKADEKKEKKEKKKKKKELAAPEGSPTLKFS